MKAAVRAVLFNLVINSEGEKIKTIYTILESPFLEVPPDQTAEEAFMTESGYLRAAVSGVIRDGLEIVAKGFANHFELYIIEEEE